RRGAGGGHGWRLRAANGDGRRTRCPAGAPLRAGTATGGPHRGGAARPSRRVRRSGALGDLVQALGDGALAVRGLVLVDDALAGGLVQLAGGGALQLGGLLHVPGLGGLAELADGGLQGRPDPAGPAPGLLVLPDALLLLLDVGHAKTCSSNFRSVRRRARPCPRAADPR